MYVAQFKVHGHFHLQCCWMTCGFCLDAMNAKLGKDNDAAATNRSLPVRDSLVGFE